MARHVTLTPPVASRVVGATSRIAALEVGSLGVAGNPSEVAEGGQPH
jgi:hypothetical protein